LELVDLLRWRRWRWWSWLKGAGVKGLGESRATIISSSFGLRRVHFVGF
jgi:hypothetical protein